MGFFDWLTGKKNAPAANTRPAAPAANMMVAAPTAAPPAPNTQSGGRKRTRKNKKSRKTTRKNRKGSC